MTALFYESYHSKCKTAQLSSYKSTIFATQNLKFIPSSMLPKFKRILLKLSGESLMGDKNFGLDSQVLSQYAQDIKLITELGVQVAIVIGGGNIYRGMNEAETGIESAQGDYMGMLATVINGMALQSALERVGVYTRLQSAIKMEQIAEPYISADVPYGIWKKEEW